MDAMREFARAIVLHLRKHGHEALFAGGCVRDEILGLKPKDYDVATNALPDDTEKLFTPEQLAADGWQYPNTHTIAVGKSFGIIVVVCGSELKVEIATLRNDGQYSDGRRPDAVKFVTSFEADAARRDFTINAMFLDPVSGERFDFFGGEADLKAGIIRAVGDAEARIEEDKLRMLRAMRFAARFNFRIDRALLTAIKGQATEIRHVSAERIRQELEGLLCAAHPLIGLNYLEQTQLLVLIFPEMMYMFTDLGEQDPLWHPEGNYWNHTRLVVDGLTGSHFILMLAGLLHDIAKGVTQRRWPDGGISNHEHDEVGAEMARVICRRLKLSNDETDRVCDLILLHMRMHKVRDLRLGKLVNLLRRPDIDDLIALQHADSQGTWRRDRSSRSHREFLRAKLHELTSKVHAKPLITGDMLIRMGFQPGPSFRVLKDAGLLAQNEGLFVDPAEAEAWVKANATRLLEEEAAPEV